MMKNKFTPGLFFLFIAILFTAQVNAQTAEAAAKSDKEIVLNQTIAYSTKVVQVSFNGNDGDTGFFSVMDVNGVVVRQVDVVELIKSPSYFSLDVSGLAPGDYTFSIKTNLKTYTSVISIK